jgi:molecular chaperone HscC
MGRIIGIDLGTTNSLASVMINGESQLIPNAFGEYLTPSVVSFGEDGKVFVGKTAKERLVSYPESTFASFKRFMGRDKTYGKYRPEELSSFILRSLKADAEKYLNEPVEEAVISVPAYFDDRARQATKNAGALAGLKVDRIINEPSAAALGYLKGLASNEDLGNEDRIIMIFDFGGGTLDVSLLETFDNVLEIVSVSGDNSLGGIDFDKTIADYFIKKAGMSDSEIDQSLYNIILKAAEKAKMDLTDKSTAQIRVVFESYQRTVEISSKELIEISTPVLKRVFKPIQDLLSNSAYSVDQITDVLMVGGSSKMPIIQHYIKRVMDRDSVYVKSPDYMIAIGMGVYAAIKERKDDIKDILLTDVCPFSLGTSVHNKANDNMPLTSFIIPRNTALPASHKEIYYPTTDGQEVIHVDVLQGEEYLAEDNIELGAVKVELPKESTTATQIHITFSYDINGILVVDVEVPQFGIKENKVIVDKGVNHSSEYIDEKVKELAKIKMLDRNEEEDTQIVQWGTRLFAQTSGALKREIGLKLDYFQNALVSLDTYHKMRVRNYIKKWLMNIENMMNRLGKSSFEEDDSWENDEDKMIEKIYKDWKEDKPQ